MYINKKRLKVIPLTLLYKVILDLTYIFYINKAYYYEGFHLELISSKIIESFLMTIIIALSLPIDERKPSTIALNTLNIIMILPILTIYSYKNESRLYFYMIVISFLMTIFIVRLIPNIKITVKERLNRAFNFILILSGILVYGILLFYNGLPSLEVLDFSKIYSIRGNINYGFTFMKYLVPWQANIINVFYMVTFFIKEQKKRFYLMVALQLLLYMITSHKTYFFYPLVIPILIFFIKKTRFIMGSLVGIISVVLISVGSYFLNLNVMLGAMFVNRTLFLPAQISFQYHEFFSENGLVMLSHSFLKPFFSTPIYNIHPIRMIGSVYYRDNWPNTGYLGDAYMNFGYGGMVFFSIVIAIILIIIDSISNTEGKRLISGSMAVIFMISLTNGALFTSLLNGGILLYILIVLNYKDWIGYTK